MSTPFTIITQTPVTDANFISSNIAEDEVAYDLNQSYVIGDRVALKTGATILVNGVVIPVDEKYIHKIYVAIQANSHPNHQHPIVYDAIIRQQVLNSAFWVPVSPTNQRAMFDRSTGTSTTSNILGTLLTPSTIEVVLKADNITSVGLIDLDASFVEVFVRIRNTINNSIIKTFNTQRIDLKDQSVLISWFDYFFTEPMLQTQATFLELTPQFSKPNERVELVVKISKTFGFAKCGTFVMGKRTKFGNISYGASATIEDFSRKETNEFGVTDLVERTFRKTASVDMLINNETVDGVMRILSSLRAKPSLFIGVRDSFETFTIYGYFEDFGISVVYPNESVLNIEIRGLT